MSAEVKQVSNPEIVKINGRLDAYNVPKFKQAFEHALEKATDFVLDMSECDFIDSTGLGAIVASLKSASQGGGDVKIACLQEKPRMVFDITRAYKIFEIFDEVEAAVASFVEEI